MNLNKLEYLIAIADEGTLSGAAKRLYVSQPALSKALAALEAELGFPLIERCSSRLVPTPEGKLYIEASKKMLAIKAEVDERISQIAQNKVYPPVRIGINNSTAIADMMLFMVNQMPLELPIFFDVDSAECTTMLQKGQLDIASMLLPGDLPDDLECIMTEPDSLVIVVPTTPNFDYINLSYTDTIPIKDLNGAMAIQSRPESGLGALSIRYLEANHVSLNYVLSINVLSAIMLALERGVGLTLMHRSNVRENPAYRVYVPDPPMNYEHFLCIRKNAELSPNAKRILKLLWGLEL